MTPSEPWPWLALAGLGLFHGLNPAMGWLFAVGLGMHRRSAKVVALALGPIALGHAVSVALFVALFLAFGLMLDHRLLLLAGGAVLVGWGLWLTIVGHRGAPRIGMRTGWLGLGLWSFLMASAHGAGLMLVPIILPMCSSHGPGAAHLAPGAAPLLLAAVAVHSAVMLTTIGAVSLTVYHWVGVGFLRRAWINLDRVWGLALIGAGAILAAT
ncbi:MAG TPA: hypothetical protein VGS12_12860 [Caulobacteraceae bacterium]|nr:hypothetical protein [Caulobacteraceae bacterium]